MNKLFVNKYALMCIITSIMLLITFFISNEKPMYNDSTEIIGIVYDVTKTDNGYIFYVDDTDGIYNKCFSRSEPIKERLYLIQGKISEDKNIFFTEHMEILTLK